MQTLPSVCVMIPTYNQAGFIATAVASALQQDYPNLQVMVADDGSTDGTATLLAPLVEQGKIIYYQNQPNIGRVANYHKCLYEYATADWVLNLDGDDYFTNPSYITQAMAAIEQAGLESVLFYQGVHIFKTALKEKLYQTNVQQEQVITGQDYFLHFFRFKHFSHMSALYNRQAAMASGFYEQDAISSDIYSFMKLGLNNPNSKIILSNNISGVWLQHGENASKSIAVKRHWRNFQLYRRLYHQALKKGYGKWQSIRWYLGATKESSRMYLSTLLKRLKG